MQEFSMKAGMTMQTVMIVGAGKGGTAILKIIKETAVLDVKAMVDIDPDAEGLLLANIGKLYVAQDSPESAIQQLQKSVEVRETIRAGIRQLPPADQQAYTNSIADDYRLLADLLRQQNHDQEAQAVLDLL